MDIEQLKSTLRSLAVSSPVQMTVAGLQRDYRNMMGEPLPVHKFGYRDVLLFLKERCGDSFLFLGLGQNTVLVPIVRDTVKHIDKMVQKQRIDPKMRHKGKRWSVEEKQVSPAPNLIAKTFPAKKPPEIDTTSKDVSRNQNSVPTKSTKSNEPYRHPHYNDLRVTDSHNSTVHKPEIKNSENDTKSQYTNQTGPISNQNTTKPVNLRPITKSEFRQSPDKESTLQKYKSVLRLGDEENYRHENQENNAISPDSSKNMLRKRLPLYESTQDLDKTSYRDSDSGKCTSESDPHSVSSSGRQTQLEQLKWELTRLVLDSKDGVCCTDLMKLYRERYNRELNFSRFGYTSIAALALTLPEVQSFRDAAGTTRLLSASAPKPAPRPVSRASRAVSRTRLNVHTERDEEDALPGIPYDPEVFPEDCLHYSESIPSMSLDDIAVGDMIELMVGEVYSPSHFWFYRLGDNHNIAMENIMDEMTEYYKKGDGKDRVLAMGAVRAGHYCSSVYDNDWHRSLIVKVEDIDTVKVRHVDYGTVDRVFRSTLKPLVRKWGSLPAQAIRGRLAGVRPLGNGRRWAHTAAAAFLKFVQDRKLVGNVISVDRVENIIELYLIDTSTECDIRIDSELINAGHAEPRTQPHADALAEHYLYPRFDAIEQGDTLNYAGIVQLLSHGFALDCVEEYRRYVPSALPSPPLALQHQPSPPPSPTPLAPSPPPPTPPPRLDNRIPFLPVTHSPSPSDSEFDKEQSEEELESLENEIKATASEPAESKSGLKPEPENRNSKPVASIPRVPEAQIMPESRGVQPRLASVAPRPHCPPPPAPLFAPPPLSAPSMPALPFFVYPQPVRNPHHASTMTLPGAYPPPPLGTYPSMDIYGPPPGLYPPNMYAPPPRFPPDYSQACYNNMPRPQPSFVSAPRPQMSQANVPTSSPPSYSSSQNTAQNDGSRLVRTDNGEVVLTVSECQIFNLLSSIDPNAAQWYMVDAISRAMERRNDPTFSRPAPRFSQNVSVSTADISVNTPNSGLNPLASEFRASAHTISEGTQTAAPRMRPPPGFESECPKARHDQP